MILFFLSVSLLAVYISLLVFYRMGWRSAPLFKYSIQNQPSVFITVVISARNEELSLPLLLQSLKDQLYSQTNFEIIIVDDHSTDKTASIARNFPMDNTRVVQLNEFVLTKINAYKKKALEVAISFAKGELIVTTDADCIVPVTWLHSIASFYEQKKPAFIVMPVLITYQKNFLEIFQALDFMTLQGITGATVHKKFHSMCNGANLAYTKQAFIDAGGFQGIDTIASGDDMLLMHKISVMQPEKIMYLKSNSVIVTTNPMHTLKDFFNQRIRWASKTDKYDDRKILPVLVIVYLFNFMLLILPVIAVFKNDLIKMNDLHISLMQGWLFLLTIKTLAELYFLYPVATFFNQQNLLYFFPLLQPFHIMYTVIAGWLGKFGTYKWKERKVK